MRFTIQQRGGGMWWSDGDYIDTYGSIQRASSPAGLLIKVRNGRTLLCSDFPDGPIRQRIAFAPSDVARVVEFVGE